MVYLVISCIDGFWLMVLYVKIPGWVGSTTQHALDTRTKKEEKEGFDNNPAYLL